MTRTTKKNVTLLETSVKNKVAASRTRNWKDVHPAHLFWVNDGQVLKNLKELHSALRKMDKETFIHHVNEEKHDFANWIGHAVGAKGLSKEVRKLDSRSSIIRTIKAKL